MLVLVIGAAIAAICTASSVDDVRGTYKLAHDKGGNCAPSVRITDKGPELANNEVSFEGKPCGQGQLRLVRVQQGLGDAPMLRGDMIIAFQCADMRFFNFQLVSPVRDVKAPVPHDDTAFTYQRGMLYAAFWSEDKACVYSQPVTEKEDIAPPPASTSPPAPKPPVRKNATVASATTTTTNAADKVANSSANATRPASTPTASGVGLGAGIKPSEGKAPSLSGEGASNPTPQQSGGSSGGASDGSGIGSIGDTGPTSTGARRGLSAAAPWYWLAPLLVVLAILSALGFAFCTRCRRAKPKPASTAYMSESGRADYIRPASLEIADPHLVPITVPLADAAPQSATAPGSVLYHFPAVAPAPPVAPTPPSYPHHPTGHPWVEER